MYQIYSADSVSRHNLSLDEAASESSVQSAMVWSLYLSIQMAVVLTAQNLGIPTEDLEDPNFNFRALYVSGIFSIISLTNAQMKVS